MIGTHESPTMIIGASEWVALPELGIRRLRARVDTGAKSCALHAEAIETFSVGSEERVRFRVYTGHQDPGGWHPCEAKLVGIRRVRSSSGEGQQRFTIRTPIVIGHARWDVDITLADRERMRYRMLLGRTAMEHHALVYPARAFLQGKPRID